MNFTFQAKTKILFGENCIETHKKEFLSLGRRAFIITGKTSGVKSGALPVLKKIFNELEIEYLVYDGIENNPSLENVREGGLEASAFKPDFIAGVGGGSPLDAAKAVAVLAANKNMEALQLYELPYPNDPLPIAAIPTTAGTGSEVTPYAIMTRKDLQTKKSFGNEQTVPVLAFLDPALTLSMPRDVTVNTAVDAFTHAIEGYISNRSTAMSDMYALESMRIFGDCIPALRNGEFDMEVRHKLLYMSLLAGFVISQTGTTSVHSMGYSLTYFKDVPHGKANGLLLGEYLKTIYNEARQKIEASLSLLKLKDIKELKELMKALLPSDLILSWKEAAFYAQLASAQKNFTANAKQLRIMDLQEIMINSCR